MKVKTQLRFFGYRRRHSQISCGHRNKSLTTQIKEALLPIGPPFTCFSGNTEGGLADEYFARASICFRIGLKEAPSDTSHMSRHKCVSNNNTAPDRKTIGKTLIFDFENP